jgi:antitoxin PrlF
MHRSVTMTAQGQITIPKDLGEALGLKAGDHPVWSIVDGDVVVSPETVDVSDVAGYLGERVGGRTSVENIDASPRGAAGLHVLGERGLARKDDAA